MPSMSLLRASTLTLLLTLTVGAAQAASPGDAPGANTNATGAAQTQVSQFPGSAAAPDRRPDAAPARANDATQGRYYDEQDQWIDQQTGQPAPGSPASKDSGG